MQCCTLCSNTCKYCSNIVSCCFIRELKSPLKSCVVRWAGKLESIPRNMNPLEIAVCLFVYGGLVFGEVEQSTFFTWDRHTSGTTDPRASRLVTVSSLVRRSRLPLPWNVMLLLFSKAALFCRLAIGDQPALCTSTQARGNKPVSLPSSLFSLSLSLSLPLLLSLSLFPPSSF